MSSTTTSHSVSFLSENGEASCLLITITKNTSKKKNQLLLYHILQQKGQFLFPFFKYVYSSSMVLKKQSKQSSRNGYQCQMPVLEKWFQLLLNTNSTCTKSTPCPILTSFCRASFYTMQS